MKRRTQLTLGLGLLALAPVALAQGGDIALLNVVTHGNTQEYSVKIQVLILVNNILLGKAEVVVVNEKYGLRVLEFNTRDINDLAP
ncbi:FliM/FliN family flagellar motor switch protein [Escherichia coli]|nr:FliM/FliN family flagellar motor switch protein [Escherichia coli]